MVNNVLSKALLFDRNFQLLGFFTDAKDVAANLMQKHPNADFCYMPHDSNKSHHARLQLAPFADANTVAELETPAELLKIINKVQNEVNNDPDTISFLAVQHEDFVIRYKIRTVTGFLRSLYKLFSAIGEKSYEKLESLLWYQNKNLRKIFELETGVKLGTSDKSMRLALKNWLASIE